MRRKRRPDSDVACANIGARCTSQSSQLFTPKALARGLCFVAGRRHQHRKKKDKKTTKKKATDSPRSLRHPSYQTMPTTSLPCPSLHFFLSFLSLPPFCFLSSTNWLLCCARHHMARSEHARSQAHALSLNTAHTHRPIEQENKTAPRILVARVRYPNPCLVVFCSCLSLSVRQSCQLTFQAKKYFILTKNSVIQAFTMRSCMAIPPTAEERIPFRRKRINTKTSAAKKRKIKSDRVEDKSGGGEQELGCRPSTTPLAVFSCFALQQLTSSQQADDGARRFTSFADKDGDGLGATTG